MSGVRPSAEFIAEHAQDVRVDRERCRAVARSVRAQMAAQNYSPATWSTHALNPPRTFPGLVDWIFTVDTLNFSFWQDEPRFTVRYGGAAYTGYWSLAAAVHRALDEGVRITSPAFWASDAFTPAVCARVFRPDANGAAVPLLAERYAALREAGAALAARGWQSFEQVLAEEPAARSAVGLVRWLAANVGSYNDVARYAGREVRLYKRAQILAADLWASGAARFADIGELTMFADYRVPQLLAVLGCIAYSDALAARVRHREPLPSGSRAEVEIRGCAILAVELVVAAIRELAPEAAAGVNAVLVDFYLWDTAKEQERENDARVECHRTRSVFY